MLLGASRAGRDIATSSKASYGMCLFVLLHFAHHHVVLKVTDAVPKNLDHFTARGRHKRAECDRLRQGSGQACGPSRYSLQAGREMVSEPRPVLFKQMPDQLPIRIKLGGI